MWGWGMWIEERPPRVVGGGGSDARRRPRARPIVPVELARAAAGGALRRTADLAGRAGAVRAVGLAAAAGAICRPSRTCPITSPPRTSSRIPTSIPQFAFNGLFKSNALLTLWLYLLGGHGLFGAARAFVGDRPGRERARAAAVPASLRGTARACRSRRCSPGRWCTASCVSMGFLNFAFAFALSLILLTVLDRQRERPTPCRAAWASPRSRA